MSTLHTAVGKNRAIVYTKTYVYQCWFLPKNIGFTEYYVVTSQQIYEVAIINNLPVNHQDIRK
jgi:hypothetical protein